MTTPRIAVLPEALASQIAAGEVVERPASAIKELVENAIDAGASRCDVEIAGGGVTRISVRDDGSGMDEADARLALQRHATSKIRTLADLQRVQSYGFRGEALASIASVSRLRLRTRMPEQDSGVEVRVDGGAAPQVAVAGVPPGTEIEVLDLFFNVPARRKFLRSIGTESGHVGDVVEAAALAHPGLTFTLRRDGRLVREWLRAEDREARVRSSFGDEPLTAQRGARGPLSLEAFLSRPERARSGAGGLTLLVNGRPVRDRALALTVAQAYGSVLERGHYPRGVVYLEIAPELVDVNVHPQKCEVRFVDPRAVSDAVYAMLSVHLAGAFSLPAPSRSPWAAQRRDAAGGGAARAHQAGGTAARAPDAGLWGTRGAAGGGGAPAAAGAVTAGGAAAAVRGEVTADSRADPPLGSEPGGAALEPSSVAAAQIPLAGWGGGDAWGLSPAESAPLEVRDASTAGSSGLAPGAARGDADGGARRATDGAPGVESPPLGAIDAGPVLAPPAPRGAARQIEWSRLRFIAQVRRTYLICEGPLGLHIIDQHAADERVNFHRLQQQYRSREVAAQALLFPTVVEVDASDVELIETHGSDFSNLGFELRVVGQRSVSVHTIPRLLARASPERLLRDLLAEAGRTGGRAFSAAVDLALATMACHGSIRAGDAMTAQEVAALLDALDQVDFAGHCPHGRPLVSYTAWSELERKVGRR